METEKKNDNIAEAFEDDGDGDDEDSVETAKDLVKIDEKENEKKAFGIMSGNEKDGEIEITDEEMSNDTKEFTVKFTREEKEKTVEEGKNSLGQGQSQGYRLPYVQGWHRDTGL